MATVVVCGAGIAGVSTAFHLTRLGVTDVVIVDPRPPLTLTSDKSTECYRDWWPNRPMVQLMSRSIELIERYAAETDHRFGLNRRGYLYLTADQPGLSGLMRGAASAADSGAGEIRRHDRSYSTYDPSPVSAGADIFTDGDELRRHFPFVSPSAVGGVHVRNAGWLSAQQMGMWMLEQAREAGADLVRAAVTDVTVANDRVASVVLDNGSVIQAEHFVNAAGPMLPEIGRMVGVELPVFSEAHLKTAFRDHLGAVPRSAPMLIWSDTQTIEWTDDELALLTELGRHDLIDALPAGCHARPEGGADSPWVLGLWEYGAKPIKPQWPIPTDQLYTEIVLRGLAAMVPAMSDYLERLPEAQVDGGYYTKTVENRPLAGPVGPKGSYVCGALSGFGIMASCGVGELTATAVTGGEMPEWAPAFDLRRYEDPTYVAGVAGADSGQL